MSRSNSPRSPQKMALNNLSKFNIFIALIITRQEIVDAVTNYLLDNTVGTHETPQQSLYPGASQTYYLPYQKYVPSSDDKYTVAHIPYVVTSTEKTLLSPTYKVPLGTSTYPSEAAKSSQGKVSYPYLYTLAKAVPPTPTAYTSASSEEGDFNYYTKEEPKKYQFGYRVSNPHTGTEFGHSEVNDGHSARGYYHVLLPDGRLQNVKYWAGPSGYHATITYEQQY